MDFFSIFSFFGWVDLFLVLNLRLFLLIFLPIQVYAFVPPAEIVFDCAEGKKESVKEYYELLRVMDPSEKWNNDKYQEVVEGCQSLLKARIEGAPSNLDVCLPSDSKEEVIKKIINWYRENQVKKLDDSFSGVVDLALLAL